MDGWKMVSSIATTIQAVVVVASLAFIWRQIHLQTQQMRLQTNLAKAANIQALVGLYSPFSLSLITDAQHAKLWVEGAAGFESLGKVDKFRYETQLFWWLVLHENVHYQKRCGFLDDVVYEAWNRDLRRFVVMQNLDAHWAGMRSLFHQDFAKHVDSVIQQLKRDPSSDDQSR